MKKNSFRLSHFRSWRRVLKQLFVASIYKYFHFHFVFGYTLWLNEIFKAGVLVMMRAHVVKGSEEQIVLMICERGIHTLNLKTLPLFPRISAFLILISILQTFCICFCIKLPFRKWKDLQFLFLSSSISLLEILSTQSQYSFFFFKKSLYMRRREKKLLMDNDSCFHSSKHKFSYVYLFHGETTSKVKIEVLFRKSSNVLKFFKFVSNNTKRYRTLNKSSNSTFWSYKTKNSFPLLISILINWNFIKSFEYLER